MMHSEDWCLANCSSLTPTQENHDVLIKSLVEDRRFDAKKSAAACIVYKSLLHWRSFEAEKTNIFDRIIQTIRSSVEGAESSGELAYWLSTTSTLLYLLQNTLKASSSSSKGSNRSRTATGSLFSRMVLVSSPSRLLFCMNKGFYLRLQRQVCQGPHNTGHW